MNINSLLFPLSSFFFPILNIQLQYFPKCISQGTNTNLLYATWKMRPVIQKLYEDCYILYSPSWSFCFTVLEAIRLGSVCMYRLLWLFVLAFCFSVAQLCVPLFAPWTAACHTSLSFTISLSLLKLMCIESVMTSSHLVLPSPSPPAFSLSQHQGLF